MSSTREELLFIEDILESVTAIEGYIYGMSFDDFIKDRKTVSATIREFEIIGEAVANISDETKDRCPESQSKRKQKKPCSWLLKYMTL